MSLLEIQDHLNSIISEYPEELSTEQTEELCDRCEEYLRTVNPNPKPRPH